MNKQLFYTTINKAIGLYVIHKNRFQVLLKSVFGMASLLANRRGAFFLGLFAVRCGSVQCTLGCLRNFEP